MRTTMHGFSISTCGVRADILTDCEETRNIVDRYLLPWLPRLAAEPAAAGIVFQIGRSPDGSGFELEDGGADVFRSPRLERVIAALQSRLDEAIVHGAEAFVPIHAGVAAWQGRVILVPGVSHAGKSTLVAELLRRGFVYFSDEYALIDDGGRAHPYPRALMLRNDSDQTYPVLAAEWNARIAEEPAPVRLILALNYTQGQAWSIRPVSQSEMLMTLLKSTPHYLAGAVDIVAPLVRLASGAACYAGVRGEAADAASHILELLGSLS